jgi:RHS repeat-associated protein
VAAQYNYDAYGKNLFDINNTATNILYSGEQFDPNLQMQYLRARYYDQNNGTFNRLDPFNGNMGDPQSLHKYAYCHGDPVNGIDPSGENGLFLLASMVIILTGILIISDMYSSATTIYSKYTKHHVASTITKLTPKNIIETARKYLDSSRWSKWNYLDEYFVFGTNKCNKFVYDVISEIVQGAVRSIVSNRGFLRPPTAREWADPNFNLPGWSKPINNPPAGSVISNGNHTGFITDKQTSISASSRY